MQLKTAVRRGRCFIAGQVGGGQLCCLDHAALGIVPLGLGLRGQSGQFY